MAKSQSLWQVIEGTGVGIFGVVFLVLGFRDLYLANRSRFWPQTAGSVISSQVHSGLVLKNPEIEYQYAVGSSEFTGKTYRFGDSDYFSHDSAAAVVAKHSEGKNIDVSFDRKNPARAVLEPGFSTDNIREIVWGVFALLTSFSVLRSEWRKFQAPDWEQEE